MSDSKQPTIMTVTSDKNFKTAYSSSGIGKLSAETPRHALDQINEQLPQNIVSELISNPRKKGIDAKNIDIKCDLLKSNIKSSNDGNPFKNSDDIVSCVLSRKTKCSKDYDINDTSMYDEGLKFIVDMCNEASFYSLDRSILSCVKVFPKLWYEEDNYPPPKGTSDRVSIKQYDFDINHKTLSADEMMIKQEFLTMRTKDYMNVVFNFDIRPDKLTYQEDCEINRSLEYKFCDSETNIICNNQPIIYKDIKTEMCIRTEIKLYVDSRDSNKSFIGYEGLLLKDTRTGSDGDNKILPRIISLHNGLEVDRETKNYIKVIPSESQVDTYYSAARTPFRESIEEKLKSIGGGGSDNCSFILGGQDCIYNFNTDIIKNNADHKKYHMTEFKIKFPDERSMHDESRLFLKKITDPKKYTPPNNAHFYKIIESIREGNYKKAIETWGTKYTSVNYYTCGGCNEELDSSKFIIKEKKPGGKCSICRKKTNPIKKKKKIKFNSSKVKKHNTDTSVADTSATSATSTADPQDNLPESSEIPPPLPPNKDRYSEVISEELRLKLKALNLSKEELYNLTMK